MGLADVVMGGGAAKDVHIFRLTRARAGGTQEEVAAAFAAEKKAATTDE